MAATTATFKSLKDAFGSGRFPMILKKFSISTILTYFLGINNDMRAIRDVSFELFTHGHVSEIAVKEDSTAHKVLVKAECLAHMRQKTYTLLVILSTDDQGDILQANCTCPDGKGPKASCKHLAALCYALEDFVKQFLLTEDIPSCTDKLEAWNKPRDVKLPATPIYDIDFSRQKFGHQRKEKRQLKGHRPEHYNLNSVCESDKSAITDFVSDLNAWSEQTQKNVLLTTVIDENDLFETSSSVNPLYEYMVKFSNEIENVCSNNDFATADRDSNQESLQRLRSCLNVDESEQNIIQTNTLLQSKLSDWFTLRQYRITGSVVHRVCNYYKYKRAQPSNIVKAIMEPTVFKNANTQLGLEYEPRVLEKYLSRSESGITLKKIGLRIDTEYGFLAASPDSCVAENGTLTGLVEVKTKISDKFSKLPIADCVKDTGYPLKKVTELNTGEVKFNLKENDKWYHQIQLQLFVCRSFAKFCDLVLWHVESDDFIIVRIEPDYSWVDKNLPDLRKFFDTYMAPKIVLRHTVK